MVTKSIFDRIWGVSFPPFVLNCLVVLGLPDCPLLDLLLLLCRVTVIIL